MISLNRLCGVKWGCIWLPESVLLRFNSQFSADFHWEFSVVENQVITFITGKLGVLSESFQVENWRIVNLNGTIVFSKRSLQFRLILGGITEQCFLTTCVVQCDRPNIIVSILSLIVHYYLSSLTMISGTYLHVQVIDLNLANYGGYINCVVVVFMRRKQARNYSCSFAECMALVDISHSVKPYKFYLQLQWVSIMDQLQKNVCNIDLLASC